MIDRTNQTYMSPFRCSVCGYSVVFALCNEPFSFHANANEFDYWYYCSNKVCIKHDGEGNYSGSEQPDWMERCGKD